MNKSSATIMAAALMLASSCTEVKQEGQGYEPIIGKKSPSKMAVSPPKPCGQWDV